MNQEEKIEAYLGGVLSAKEQAAFEKAIANDPDLQEKIRQHQAVLEGIKGFFQDQTLARFQVLEAQITTKDTAKKNRLLLWSSLGIAASLLLLFWVWNPFSAVNPDNLYASYYTTYPNYVDNIERNDIVTNNSYKNAFTAYEQQRYQDAIQLFRQLSIPSDPIIEFYWGLSLLELNDYTGAIPHLNNAVIAPKHRYSINAIWYQALALIQIKSYSKAIPLLQKLIRSNSTYKEKAAIIIDQISSK